MFGEILLRCCTDNSLIIIDKESLPGDTYTYVSSAWGTISWLDHVVCTYDTKDCITDIKVMYASIVSDDHPVLCTVTLSELPECEGSTING